MAYRNGTYVAFHANGTNVPIDSDIKYYNLIKAWEGKGDDDFTFVNSHEKTAAVRDSSSKETLARSLRERMNSSKNVLLLLGSTTRFDDDWIPFEIEYSVDVCKIPLIVCYLNETRPIYNPTSLSAYWPRALSTRITNESAHCIHIPLKKEVIHMAINQFSHNSYPNGQGLGFYSESAYRQCNVF
jgi:hypothetical protein